MPNEIMLEVYSFQVRKKGQKKIYESLNPFLGNKDFFTFIKEYFEGHVKTLVTDTALKKSILLAENSYQIDEQARMVSGLMDCGDYGITSRIVNSQGAHTYDRKDDDNDMRPYYYLVYVPEKLNIGFIVLQRTGIHGIHNIFTKNFEARFDEKFPDLVLEYNQFVARQLAAKIADEGNLTKIIMKRRNLPPNIEDQFGVRELGVDIGDIRLEIATRGLFRREGLKKYLKGENAAFFEIPLGAQELGFDGRHKTFLKFEIGGKTRTVDMSDSGKLRPYFDIDAEVERLPNKHPKLESIDAIAKQLITDLTAPAVG